MYRFNKSKNRYSLCSYKAYILVEETGKKKGRCTIIASAVREEVQSVREALRRSLCSRSGRGEQRFPEESDFEAVNSVSIACEGRLLEAEEGRIEFQAEKGKRTKTVREVQIDPYANMKALCGCRIAEPGLREQDREKGGRNELGKMSKTWGR